MTKSTEEVKKRWWESKLFVIILILAFFGTLICLIDVYGKSTLVNTPKTVLVENLFIDINGDKKIDYLVKGEIILNTDETINFLLSQSQKQQK